MQMTSVSGLCIGLIAVYLFRKALKHTGSCVPARAVLRANLERGVCASATLVWAAITKAK